MAVSGRHCSKLARRPSELRRPDFKSEERRTAWVWRIPSNAQARDRLLTAARDGRLAAALQRKTAANGACFHGCSPRKTRRLSLPCQVSEDLLMSYRSCFCRTWRAQALRKFRCCRTARAWKRSVRRLGLGRRDIDHKSREEIPPQQWEQLRLSSQGSSQATVCEDLRCAAQLRHPNSKLNRAGWSKFAQ